MIDFFSAYRKATVINSLVVVKIITSLIFRLTTYELPLILLNLLDVLLSIVVIILLSRSEKVYLLVLFSFILQLIFMNFWLGDFSYYFTSLLMIFFSIIIFFKSIKDTAIFSFLFSVLIIFESIWVILIDF